MKFEQQVSQKQTQTQKLLMTQSLQQSLQVLHFSIDELNQYIKSQSMENPLIEIKEANYTSNYAKPKSSTGQELDSFSQVADIHESLFEHLIQQIHLNYRDTYLRILVLFLVEYIDLNGYLKITFEEAQQITKAEPIQMLDALTLIQQLDPAGVGARNLQECLMLQTERDQKAPSLAYYVLEEFFDELVGRKWDVIAKKLNIGLNEIQLIFDYIQTLTPTPGAQYGSVEGLYVIPDITVKVEEGKLKVIPNRQGMPELRFQQNYFEQFKDSQDIEVKIYLQNKVQEFESLRKAIMQRGDTVLAVGKYIIDAQQEYFLDATRPLKPLTMKEVANALDIHESTVSRAVNGKYIETDNGIVEMRDFFVQSIVGTDGKEVANSQVKTRLKELVDQENKRKPLSDQKLSEILVDEGMEISRRTVAKYRDELGILVSSKRKRFD